jgi:hypothetical protein
MARLITSTSKYYLKLVAAFFLGFALGIILTASFLRVSNVSARTVNGGGCVDVYAPNPETFELNVAKRGTVMATYKWFEEPEGTWTLKVDIDARGGVENWVGTYPNWWNVLLTRPQELPQQIVEVVCPSKEKSVTIVEACDGSATVTIYGGDTRRTWRVNEEKKWVEKYTTEVWETTVPVTVEWWHENSSAWKTADEAYVKRTEAENCEVPVEQPRATTPAGAPVCTDTTPLIVPSNVHVVRSGANATVNFFTSSSNANIYFKEVSATGWQHALRDIPVTGGYVSVTIHDLNPALGYTFGIQAANSCAGGETVVAVVVDGPSSVTFPMNYWEWLK